MDPSPVNAANAHDSPTPWWEDPDISNIADLNDKALQIGLFRSLKAIANASVYKDAAGNPASLYPSTLYGIRDGKSEGSDETLEGLSHAYNIPLHRLKDLRKGIRRRVRVDWKPPREFDNSPFISQKYVNSLWDGIRSVHEVGANAYAQAYSDCLTLVQDRLHERYGMSLSDLDIEAPPAALFGLDDDAR